MAKKEKEKEKEEDIKSMSTLALSRALIKEMNKDSEEKVAWSLATDKDNPTDVKDWISTGSTVLDYQIGNKRGAGIPCGKITEVVGEEATGKSLLVTQILANTQKKGGLAVYFDEENALNPDFATRLGLNLSELVYMQVGYVEAVGEHIQKIIALARAKDVKKPITIVWDSMAATPAKAELEGDFDPNSRIGLQAKAISKMMRLLTKTVGRERVTLVFTNQMKVKIGVMYGDPMGTPGGKAVPYHASVRIRLKRVKEVINEKTKEVLGVKTRSKVFKNRMGPPMRACEFDIMYADGVNDGDSIRDCLHEKGEIKKVNGWMYMSGVPITSFEFDEKTGEVDKTKTPKVEVKEELQFRAREFDEYWSTDPAFKEHVLGLLDKHLIVKYDAKSIPDQDIDPDSLTDVEAVAEMELGDSAMEG